MSCSNSCPKNVENALYCLRFFLFTMQPDRPNPFDNVGVSGDITLSEVEILAYHWDETGELPYNFKWRNIEVSWYKYLGRGMQINRIPDDLEVQEMLIACMVELSTYAIMNKIKRTVDEYVKQPTPNKPGRVIHGYCNHSTTACKDRDISSDLYLCTKIGACMWKEDLCNRLNLTIPGKDERNKKGKG